LSRGFSGLIYARDTESPPGLPWWARKGFKVNLRASDTGAGQILADRQGTGSGNMADSREVMNIRQASHYLGVSPDTLYKYVGEQKIPAFKLGNRWRFKKSRLDQWMEEKSSQMEPGAKQKPKAASKAAGSQ
jgi:excisionase family DNA binding protein